MVDSLMKGKALLEWSGSSNALREIKLLLEVYFLHYRCDAFESFIVHLYKFFALECSENFRVITFNESRLNLSDKSCAELFIEYWVSSHIVVSVCWSFPDDDTLGLIKLTASDTFVVGLKVESTNLVGAIVNELSSFVV